MPTGQSIPFVAYYRVSTSKQGVSGLGIEAQQAAVREYARRSGSTIVAEFLEIESGRKSERPQLMLAIDLCRCLKASLLIAKLDRLARNVHFISGLMETGVNFLALDMPSADRFMLHVYAAMAEEEGRRIGARTKAALVAAKARGVKLGTNAKVLADKEKAAAVEFAGLLDTIVAAIRADGSSSIRQVCLSLNARGIESREGKRWHPTSVARLLRRQEITARVPPA